MRISHKYRFIFISKPRCASTAVRSLLDPYSDILSSSQPPFHHHVTALELKTYFDKEGWNWNHYFSFTTVRNPWEMIVSYFTYFKPDINGLYNFEKEREGLIYQPNRQATFTGWVETARTHHRFGFLNGEYINNNWVDGFSKLTLANTVNDIKGISLVARILKVENLEISLQEVLRYLGIHAEVKQFKLNSTLHKGYRDYYTPQTKRIIEEQFISDIEFGDYVF